MLAFLLTFPKMESKYRRYLLAPIASIECLHFLLAISFESRAMRSIDLAFHFRVLAKQISKIFAAIKP